MMFSSSILFASGSKMPAAVASEVVAPPAAKARPVQRGNWVADSGGAASRTVTRVAVASVEVPPGRGMSSTHRAPTQPCSMQERAARDAGGSADTGMLTAMEDERAAILVRGFVTL